MKIILIQTAIADYREKFIECLNKKYRSEGVDFKVITGVSYFEETTNTSDYVLSQKNTHTAYNAFLFKRKVLLQVYSFFDVMLADVVVCELNPRILNTWIIIILRRVLRKRVVVWGHAWPRQGSSSKTDIIRSMIRNAANAILLYTETQRRELVEKGCRSALFVAPNSLYSKSDFENVFSVQSESIVYVGRLVSSKKVSLLIEGAAPFLKEKPQARLEIVGTGTESYSLRALCQKLSITSQVVFHGHISDHRLLKEIYGRCFVSVSPGYVGLSITQSFSFGIPMLIADHEPHSPEIEAFVPGLNGAFFSSDNASDLTKKIYQQYSNRSSMMLTSVKIIEDCSSRYSTEKMVEGFYESTVGK